MPALTNDRYEVAAREFVRAWMSGDPDSRRRLRDARDVAYRRAGFTADTNSARHNARRFFNRPDVRSRIQEITREYIEHADIRPEKIAVRMDRMAGANVADYYEADGRTLKNIKDLPLHMQEAIQSIEWEPVRHPDGSVESWRAKLKLYDKLAANLALMRHIGIVPEDDRPTGPIGIFNVLSIDDQRALAEAIKALPGGPGASDSRTRADDQSGPAVPETV